MKLLISAFLSTLTLSIMALEVPRQYQICQKPRDCIIGKGDICGCLAGGTGVPLNRLYAEDRRQDLIRNSQSGIICAQVISNHKTCTTKTTCLKNRCVYKK